MSQQNIQNKNRHWFMLIPSGIECKHPLDRHMSLYSIYGIKIFEHVDSIHKGFCIQYDEEPRIECLSIQYLGVFNTRQITDATITRNINHIITSVFSKGKHLKEALLIVEPPTALDKMKEIIPATETTISIAQRLYNRITTVLLAGIC